MLKSFGTIFGEINLGTLGLRRGGGRSSVSNRLRVVILEVTCRPCGVGFFSDVEGLVECKVCPVGADCYLGQTTGVPPAQPGKCAMP
eukprot:5284413-Amphidinium_carterae.1